MPCDGGTGPDRDTFKHSIGDLVRGIGLSRTSLRYHESINLISPERDELSNYRAYDDDDYLTMIAYTAMRNIGYEAGDLRDAIREGDNPFSADRLLEYQTKIERDIIYKHALLTALRRDREHRRAVDDIVNERVGTSSRGIGGDITVKVTLDGERIAAVEILKANETPEIGGVALDKMVAAVTETGPTDVYLVAGATVTCSVFLEAIQNALSA